MLTAQDDPTLVDKASRHGAATCSRQSTWSQPVSPDVLSVRDTVRRARRRAVVLAIAEAVAWAAAIGVLSRIAAVGVGALVLVWRLKKTTRPAVVRALERSHSAAPNVIVTADELSRDTLTATAGARERVFAHAAAAVRTIDIGRTIPGTPVLRAIAVASLAWLLGGAPI